MEDKINSLIQKNFFENITIDDKGFCTLYTNPTNNPNTFLKEAKLYKREADVLHKQNIENNNEETVEKYNKLYIKSILYYIKGYKMEETLAQKLISVGQWKGLYKYIKEIISLTEKEKLKSFLKSCLFAVKFHYLNLEVSVLESTEHFKYFKSEFCSLYSQFNLLDNKVALEDLEGFYSNL